MIHRRFADNTSSDSVATRLRRQRFLILLDMLADGPSRVSILDVGGRPKYWEMMAADYSDLMDRIDLTLLNVEPRDSRTGFDTVVGDARHMPQYGDGQFDIVFSNSTIEHVGDFDDQRRMAAEVRRIGRRYYVQTPNRYFPIEPHFEFPLFQFLPVRARVWLVRRFQLGWMPKMPDRERAEREVTQIRLLSRGELRQLFPDARIFQERFSGLVKSFVAYTPTPSGRES